MIKAEKQHKQLVVEILSECVETNKTVNWILKQDDQKPDRLKHLIDYSFDACIDSGRVYLTDNLNGAVICNLSSDQLPFLEEVFLTLKFIKNITGVSGVGRALKREQYIKQFHPVHDDFMYIWFIGVARGAQGRGVGSGLLKEIISLADQEQLPVYVETSVDRNVSFYKKHGFIQYHSTPPELFGFGLHFLRRLPEGKL